MGTSWQAVHVSCRSAFQFHSEKNADLGTMMPRILIAAFVLLLACPVLAKPVFPPVNRRYVPIYAHKFRPTEKHPRHSLQGISSGRLIHVICAPPRFVGFVLWAPTATKNWKAQFRRALLDWQIRIGTSLLLTGHVEAGDNSGRSSTH
jgi:hypothetical protein